MTWRGRPRGWARLQRAILLRDEYRCWICGLDDPRADTVDHVIPRINGGGHQPENLRAAHRSCNSRKGARAVMPRARIAERWRA